MIFPVVNELYNSTLTCPNCSSNSSNPSSEDIEMQNLCLTKMAEIDAECPDKPSLAGKQ